MAVIAAMAALLAVMLIPAAPAAAEGEDIPDLEITTPHKDGDIVVGGTYSLRFEVRNDSDAAITVDPGAFVDIGFAYDRNGPGPSLNDCDFASTDYYYDFELVVDFWKLELPTTLAPGFLAECEITYTPTQLDIDTGGLWSMLIYHPTSVWEDWGYWWTGGVTAKGVNYSPEIRGDGRAGYRLSATTGYWGPFTPPYVSDFEYYWHRGDQPIPRAESKTYIPTAADVGEEVSVWVVSRALGIALQSEAVVIQEPGPVVLTDVSDNPSSRYYSEFADEITWFADQGITTGYSNGDGTSQYRPFGKVTRDAMAAFLYRYAGSPAVTPPATSPFKDVTSTNSNFYDEIVWLSDQGITNGWSVRGGTEYRPFNSITRDAMAAFLYRYAGEPAFSTPTESPFEDVDPTSTEFYTEITWLAETGITTGWDTSAGKEFRPFSPITRDAMAAFIYRYDEKFGEPESAAGSLSELPADELPLAGAQSGPAASSVAPSTGGPFVSCVEAAGCPGADVEPVKPTGK